MAASSIVLTNSAFGRVPIDQLTTMPSKQSIMGDKYTLPAGIWKEVAPQIRTQRQVETLRQQPGPEARESRKTMSKRPRRNHSPLFKAKVAVDAIKGEKTLAELSKLHDVHANQIVDWKNQLLERAASVFGAEASSAPVIDLKELHAKIGQLALENDVLAGALTKAGMLSAKR